MLTATNTHSTHTHYSPAVLTVNNQKATKMKIKILDAEGLEQYLFIMDLKGFDK